MTTQTKAADPVLPPPSHRHPMSGEPIWDEAAARACYEKARADLIAEMRPALYGVAIYGGDLCAATYSTPAEAEAFVLRVNALRRMDRDPCVVVPLAIIPKD